MQEDILKKLVIKGHINVIERNDFKDNKIPINSIAETILKSLNENKMFPPNAEVWKLGQSVFEGYFIEKVKEDKYLLHSQRAHAIQPNMLADSKYEEFISKSEVVTEYIRLAWGDSIDGIRIDCKR